MVSICPTSDRWVKWTPVQLSVEIQEPRPMPLVVVATMTAKPESIDAVRTACEQAMEAVHSEPGCDVYALHEADNTFVFIEQWADADALQAHSVAPSVATLFETIGAHLDGAPDIKVLQPVVAGDPAKGRLRP
jgi:quinol monooxygenase YgiN